MRVPPLSGQLVAPRDHPPACVWRPADPSARTRGGLMLQRDRRLVEVARARIQAAEQDPHAWPETWPDARVVLVMDDERHGHLEPDTGQRDDDAGSDEGGLLLTRVEASAVPAEA